MDANHGSVSRNVLMVRNVKLLSFRSSHEVLFEDTLH